MQKQYSTTHKMLVAYTTEEACLITRFLNEYHYEYQYSLLGIEVDNEQLLGRETTYPKGVVFAVLKNNNIKDGKKVVFLIARDDIDNDLFKSELALFEKEINLRIEHTQHNVSIGLSKANKPCIDRNLNSTSQSVGKRWKASR